MKINNLFKVFYATLFTELFKLIIKAWNFATTLLTLRLTFSDIGPIQINF